MLRASLREIPILDLDSEDTFGADSEQIDLIAPAVPPRSDPLIRCAEIFREWALDCLFTYEYGVLSFGYGSVNGL